MSRRRGILIPATLLLLGAAAGCDSVADWRSQLGTTDTLAVPGSGSGLMLGLQASGTLRAGEVGVLRIAVTNHSDTLARNVRLELIVPGWAEPMPPRAGDREVGMTALPGGGTRFAYDMAETPIVPGQTQTVEQRIRVPAVGTGGADGAALSRVVRARLLGSDGEALAEVEGSISLDGDLAPAESSATVGLVAGRNDQIGPVRIGMTAAALRQVVPSAQDTTWTENGAARRGLWVPVGGGHRALAVLTGDSVTRLEVHGTGIRTPERLSVGASLDDLRSAYGAACADVRGGAVVVWFADEPRIAFALDAPVPGNVAELRQSPDALPGTARVTRWWVRPDAESCSR